jgi:hypothetical protein
MSGRAFKKRGVMMFIEIPKQGYHFSQGQIMVIEQKYNAKYMGPWCTKRPSGGWNETPVDVFYQPNPDTEKGHKHYFGMFFQGKTLGITDATSAFSEPMAGIICEDGEVIVSRYRHDYVQKGDRMIDGGRDYTRSSVHPSASVTVVDGEFIIQANDVK